MDVKEFVEKTLTQIVAGVNAAEPSMKEHGGGLVSKYDRHEQPVEFDIAVAASESSEKSAGGKAGLAVAGISVAGIGGSVGSSLAEASMSRIKFKVMIDYTAHKER